MEANAALGGTNRLERWPKSIETLTAEDLFPGLGFGATPRPRSPLAQARARGGLVAAEAPALAAAEAPSTAEDLIYHSRLV